MKAAVWMIGTIISFCLMAICARELSRDIDTFQVLFIRSLIGFVIVSAITYKNSLSTSFKTKRIKLHVFRNIFHFAGQYGWFLGIGLLPLAEVFALEFTVPIWTVLISAIFLNEALNFKKILAVLMGFFGVYIILSPGSELLSYYSIIVLVAAICYSISHVSTKSLTSTEHPVVVVFYMCLIQLPIGLVFALPNWVSPNPIQWIWLSVVAITALTAHYCIAQAMKYAEAGIVVTLDFLRLPSIAILGVIIYNEPFSVTLIIGAILMLVGNLLNLYKPLNRVGKA